MHVIYSQVQISLQVPSSMTVAKLRALLRRVYKKTAGSAPLDLFLLGQESQTEVARIVLLTFTSNVVAFQNGLRCGWTMT